MSPPSVKAIQSDDVRVILVQCPSLTSFKSPGNLAVYQIKGKSSNPTHSYKTMTLSHFPLSALRKRHFTIETFNVGLHSLVVFFFRQLQAILCEQGAK